MTEWGYGLVVLVHGLIAAYLLTYIKKKASDLATKENLEDLKLQLHETTTVVKSTEQHIMSDVWVAQKRWEIKKEFYSNALANFEIILDALKVVENSLKPSENDRPQPSKTLVSEKEKMIKSANSMLENEVKTIGTLFLDKEVLSAIDRYLKAEERRQAKIDLELLDPDCTDPSVGEEYHSWSSYICHQLAECIEAHRLLVEYAREDLQVMWQSDNRHSKNYDKLEAN